ncbi:hypothetical protein NUW54_g13583 [Trametes sanguinea]|uniref:Uncharacterized protein n=1 Tax=Trametes sanguinea TaxID=158606 RepID=A0ACC1MKH5_9APHY|nr:hypothetical protein NUW54_g13583 [Trametes sanguinea]
MSTLDFLHRKLLLPLPRLATRLGLPPSTQTASRPSRPSKRKGRKPLVARKRVPLAATNVDSTERQNKLAAFWDAVKERPSWKKVYANGLH